MIVSYYLARVNYSRGKRHGEAQWQRDHWKAMDARRGARGKGHDTIVIRWQEMESTGILRKPVDGPKKIADTWTTSRRSTSPMPHPGTRGTGTRAPSYLFSMMTSKLDQRKQEKISSPPRELSQIFDENKDDRTSFSRRRSEHAKDHSMKPCEQTWDGTAKIGKPIGRKLFLHHLHNNGGKTNTKTLNFELNIGGKSDGYRLFQSHIDCFHRFRVQTLANVHTTGGKTEHLVACTFFSLLHTLTTTRTCVWLKDLTAHVWDVLHLL